MMRRMFSLVAPTWRPLLAAIAFGVAALAANVGLMATSAYLLSLAALHPPISALSTAIVGVRFFGLSRAVARYVERYAGHDAALRLLCEIRIWFYRSLEPLAPSMLAPFSSADLFTRMVADVETLKFLPVRIILPVGVASVALFSITILLASLEWLLAAWVFSGLFTMSVLLPYFLQKMDRADRTDFSKARSQFHATLLDSVRGLRDLSAFGRLELMSERIHDSQSNYVKAHRSIQKTDFLGEASAGLIANLVFIGSLAMFVTLLRNGKIEGIYLAAWALGIQSIFEAFYPLPLLRNYSEEIMDAAHRLFGIASSPQALLGSGTQLPTSPFRLEVRNVVFRYGSVPAPALSHITFDLPPGKRLAVVGTSGAGKSSLVSLLASLQIPESGSILINGIALHEFEPAALQKMMGVVLQHDHLFHATIADNLRLARPGASDEDLWAAVDGVYLGDVIRNLPQLMESIIGEDGHGLSGGERRRLSLARALLKDPPLLLLDEPTAGLDPILTRNLLADDSPLLRPGRTVLVVTHQLDGLQHMDEILVLDKGRMVEKGRFDELLANHGFFYNLWSLQQDIFTHVDKNSLDDES